MSKLYLYGRQHPDGDYMLMVANHGQARCYFKHPDSDVVYDKHCRIQDEIRRHGHVSFIVELYKHAKAMNIYHTQTI